MSEDPERDEGEESTPDSHSSGSDVDETEPDADESSQENDETESHESGQEGEETEAGVDEPTDESDEPGSAAPADEEEHTRGLSPGPTRPDDADEDSSADDEEDEEMQEFVVPGMESEPNPHANADESDDPVDDDDASEPEGTEPDEAKIDERTETVKAEREEMLPENQPGVGVDVPQQTLDDGDDGILGDGPESDEEMPLADHIEEMMRRLAVVFGVAGLVAVTLLGLGEAFAWLPTAVELIDILWNNAIPGAPEMAERRPRLYGPLELILTKLKVTGLAGLLIGLPVFVYETYLFMRPGLYRNERRYYLAAVPTSLVLGTIGMAFAHYVIIPAIMEYFTVYTQENVSVAYGLAETFNLILVLMAYMAVVFQIPLFIMLAIMMGLVTRLWLEDKRLLFWGGFLTVAFLINPDPTGMTPFIIAATMIVLYEGTLALLRWTGN